MRTRNITPLWSTLILAMLWGGNAVAAIDDILEPAAEEEAPVVQPPKPSESAAAPASDEETTPSEQGTPAPQPAPQPTATPVPQPESQAPIAPTPQPAAPAPASAEPGEDQTLFGKTADQPPQKSDASEPPKEPEQKAAKKEEKKFVKGEIANIGARDIVYPYNSIGIGTGVTFIGQDIFLTLDPRFVYNKNDFNMLMAFHLPINIRLFSFDLNRAGEDNFTLRNEDWDEWQDYFRIIKYVQYGRSEDNFYASIGSNNAQTIGHGTIMKRYVPNFDPNFTKVSAKLNYYNDYVGFESVLGDVTDGNMFGGLFFVKPLSWVAENDGDYLPRSFSLGFTFVADRKAPSSLDYVDYVFDLPGTGTVVIDGNDPRWPAGLTPRIEVDKKGRPIVLDDTFLYLMGIDTELKFFKNDYVDLKTYLDYSWMKTEVARGGFTFGFLGRYNLDNDRQHLLRSRLQRPLYPLLLRHLLRHRTLRTHDQHRRGEQLRPRRPEQVSSPSRPAR